MVIWLISFIVGDIMKRVEWPYSQICAECIYGLFVHEDDNPCLYYCEINQHPNELGKCFSFKPSNSNIRGDE